MTTVEPTTTTDGSAITIHHITLAGVPQLKPRLTSFNAFAKALLVEFNSNSSHRGETCIKSNET